MKNKILGVIVICTALFCSCSLNGISVDDDSAFDVYAKAVELMENASSYQIHAVTDLNITSEASEMNSQTDADIKVVLSEKGEKQAEVNIKEFLADEKSETKGIYKDNYFYTQIGENKVKNNLEYNALINEINAYFIDIPQNSVLVNSMAENSGDSEYTLKFNISTEDISGEMPEFMEHLAGYLRVSKEDLALNNFTLTAVVDNQNILKSYYADIMAQNFIYVEGENQSVEEKALDFSLVVDVEITGYNSTSIEIPADLDSYNDISSNRES